MRVKSGANNCNKGVIEVALVLLLFIYEKGMLLQCRCTGTQRAQGSAYLLLGFLGDGPEPVSDHAEDGGEVRQAHQDPEQHHRLVVV